MSIEKDVLTEAAEWLNTPSPIRLLTGVSNSGLKCADLCARIRTILSEADYGGQSGHRK